MEKPCIGCFTKAVSEFWGCHFGGIPFFINFYKLDILLSENVHLHSLYKML